MLTVDSEPATMAAPVGDEGGTRDVRVMGVDDHPAVRVGVLQLLDEQPDLCVVDAVESAEAAMSLAERESIDVAVVDYQLGLRSGLWLSRMLKRLDPSPRVVIYSAFCDGPLAAACVVAEADALVSKSSPVNELCDAVRAVASGAKWLPPIPPRLAEGMRHRLESRDQAIFGMLLAGTGKAEVATALPISAAGLDARMWAMLQQFEGVGPEPVQTRDYGAPSLLRRW